MPLAAFRRFKPTGERVAAALVTVFLHVPPTTVHVRIRIEKDHVRRRIFAVPHGVSGVFRGVLLLHSGMLGGFDALFIMLFLSQTGRIQSHSERVDLISTSASGVIMRHKSSPRFRPHPEGPLFSWVNAQYDIHN